MKQQNKQPSQPLMVFSVFTLLFWALSPLIDYLFSLSVTLVIIPVLGLSIIVGGIIVWFNGYMRNPKFQNIFVLIGGTLHGNSYLLQF